MKQYHRQMQAPEDCPLQGRWVFGDGEVPCRIMLVGEAPGKEEASRGIPFVGKSGKELGIYLNEFAKIGRENTFITNVVKVRPPNNRDPKPEEVAWFRDYLVREIHDVKPRIIAAIGTVAGQWFYGTQKFSMEKWHGIPFTYDAGDSLITIVPCYHPSYGLHDGRQMRYIQEDFRVLGDVIRGNWEAVTQWKGHEYTLLEDGK